MQASQATECRGCVPSAPAVTGHAFAHSQCALDVRRAPQGAVAEAGNRPAGYTGQCAPHAG
eukprot:5885112-Amphidinium_carterae.1